MTGIGKTKRLKWVGSTNSQGENAAVQNVSLLSDRYPAYCRPIRAGAPMAAQADEPQLDTTLQAALLLS